MTHLSAISRLALLIVIRTEGRDCHLIMINNRLNVNNISLLRTRHTRSTMRLLRCRLPTHLGDDGITSLINVSGDAIRVVWRK